MNSTINKYDYTINDNDNSIDITTKKSGDSKLQVKYIDPATGKVHYSNIVDWNIPRKIKRIEISNAGDALLLRNIGDQQIFHSRIIFDDDTFIDDPIGIEYCQSSYQDTTNYSTKNFPNIGDREFPNFGVQWDSSPTYSEFEVIDNNGKRTFRIKVTKDTEDATGNPGGIGVIDCRLPIDNSYKSPESISNPSLFTPQISFKAKKKLSSIKIINDIINVDPITKINATKLFKVKLIYDDKSEEDVTQSNANNIIWYDDSNDKIIQFNGFKTIGSDTGFEIETKNSGKAEIYCTIERNDGAIIGSNVVEWVVNRTLQDIKINQSHSIQKIVNVEELLLNTDYYIPVQKIYDNEWDVWDDVGTNIVWELKSNTGDDVDSTYATIDTAIDGSGFMVAKVNIKKGGTYKLIATSTENPSITNNITINTIKDIKSIAIKPVNDNYGYYMNNEYKYNVTITYVDDSTSNDVNKVKWAFTKPNTVEFTVDPSDSTVMNMFYKKNDKGEIYAYDPRNSNNKSEPIVVDDGACIIKGISLGLKTLNSQSNPYDTAPIPAVIKKIGLNKVGNTGHFEILIKNNSGDCVHYGNPHMWEITSSSNISFTTSFANDKNKAHLGRGIDVTVNGTGAAFLTIKFLYPGTDTNISGERTINWNVDTL